MESYKVGTVRPLKIILLLPGNVTVVVPAFLIVIEGGVSPGWAGGEVMKAAIIFVGLLFILSGLALAVHTVRLFLRYGEGTTAPWDPTKRLVVRGAYRHVRNPMITGVLFILLGEGLATGSKYILAWFVFFFLMNHLYFIFSEEPGLKKRLGEPYVRYKGNVPRWVPRLKPYVPEDDADGDANG